MLSENNAVSSVLFSKVISRCFSHTLHYIYKTGSPIQSFRVPTENLTRSMTT